MFDLFKQDWKDVELRGRSEFCKSGLRIQTQSFGTETAGKYSRKETNHTVVFTSNRTGNLTNLGFLFTISVPQMEH